MHWHNDTEQRQGSPKVCKAGLLTSPMTGCPGWNMRLAGFGVLCVWINMLLVCICCASRGAGDGMLRPAGHARIELQNYLVHYVQEF